MVSIILLVFVGKKGVKMVNIYQTFYDLLNSYIYGGSVVAESYQDLICIALATMGVIFLVSIPFVIVWRFIRLWF